MIEKCVNSAFIGTSLEADLRRAGCRGLVIVGLTTNHCVSTTARMAGNLGFATWVVSDATATFDRVGPDGLVYRAEQIHAIALSDLHGEFATVVDTAAVVAALRFRSSRSTPMTPARLALDLRSRRCLWSRRCRARPVPPPAAKGIEPADVDRAADPCTDFYAFANGAWRAANPIPPGRRAGAGGSPPARRTGAA